MLFDMLEIRWIIISPPPREALTAEQREADKARVRAMLAARLGNDFFKTPEGKRR